ncbi:hypothetical protein LJR029_005489 [Caballeronia sp. LjRoot29]|uniref:hypothetical protein n=1 Tax=Caballeronia sp. LjRoot29 TaxID=3342315 RepID=UPI003ECDA5D3
MNRVTHDPNDPNLSKLTTAQYVILREKLLELKRVHGITEVSMRIGKDRSILCAIEWPDKKTVHVASTSIVRHEKEKRGGAS